MSMFLAFLSFLYIFKVFSTGGLMDVNLMASKDCTCLTAIACTELGNDGSESTMSYSYIQMSSPNVRL